MRLTATFWGGLVLAALLGVPVPAGAQTPAVAATEALPELRVTATRTERDLLDVPLSVWVVDREQIETQPTRTVGELLRDLPGVEMEAQSTPGMVRLHIRGESPSRVVILVDGQRISEHKSMLGVPLLLSSADIERIEVIRGPGSVLYGSEAIGGVVNIITRKGGPQPLNAAFDVSYDSVTDGWGTTGGIYGLVNHIEYSLSGAFVDHDDRETPDGVMDPSSYQSDQGSAYLGYRADNVRAGLRLERYTSELDSYPVVIAPVVDFLADVPAWDREKAALFLDVGDVSATLANVHVDLYRQTTAKHLTQEMKIAMGRLGIQPVDLDVQNDLLTWGATVQLDWTPHPDHYLITGAEFLNDALSDDEVQRAPAYSPGPPPAVVSAVHRYHDEATQQTAALFARDEWRFAPEWSLDAGVRETWVESTLDESNRPTAPRDDAADSDYVTSLALVNRSFRDLALRAGFSQGYRFPSLQEIYTGTQHSQDQRSVLGNPDLGPETSNGVEFGGRYSTRRATLDLSVFYTESRDYITYQLLPDHSAYQFLNVDDSTSFGTEALGSLTIPCGAIEMEPYLQGTYLRRVYDDGANRSYKTGYPMLSGRGGVRVSRPIGTSLRLWTDAYLRAADGCEEESLIDGTLEHFGGWTTTNLEAGLTWSRATCGRPVEWQASAGIENLTDKDYQHAGEVLTAPGRNVFVKLGCRF